MVKEVVTNNGELNLKVDTSYLCSGDNKVTFRLPQYCNDCFIRIFDVAESGNYIITTLLKKFPSNLRSLLLCGFIADKNMKLKRNIMFCDEEYVRLVKDNYSAILDIKLSKGDYLVLLFKCEDESPCSEKCKLLVNIEKVGLDIDKLSTIISVMVYASILAWLLVYSTSSTVILIAWAIIAIPLILSMILFY